MSASGFGSISTTRFAGLLVVTFLISALTCLGQSDSTEDTPPTAIRLGTTEAPVTPRNDFVVSAQELKMSGKGDKAFHKGTDLLLKGHAEESLYYLTHAVAENPLHYRAYHNLGLAYFIMGRVAEAEQAFQKSIDLSGGGFAPPLVGLGAILCQKQEFGRAQTIIRKSLELAPGSAAGMYFLALAQLGSDQLVDSEKSAQEALLRKPDFPAAYFLLALIDRAQHKAYAVLWDLQIYLKLAPHGKAELKARSLLAEAQREIARNAIAAVAANVTALAIP